MRGQTTGPIALTMGEPAGIGGEITLKAWMEREAERIDCFCVLDDPGRLRRIASDQDWPIRIIEINDPSEAGSRFNEGLPVLPVPLASDCRPGQPVGANASSVMGSIERAVELALQGRLSAVVTNPIHKKVLYETGFAHPGHTEYLAKLCAIETVPVMMLACPGLRVVPVTVHLALSAAVKALTLEKIVHAGQVTAQELRRKFGIEKPRLAVAGLNPHAGEGGSLGREEIEIVTPAVKKLQDLGIAAVGPSPADSLFHAAARERYDAVLCMYHDQALIPLKTIDFDGGVNITLGLPVIRTSPDHGTAFDIAGSGRASARSLVAAIKMAGVMARSRDSNLIATDS